VERSSGSLGPADGERKLLVVSKLVSRFPTVSFGEAALESYGPLAPAEEVLASEMVATRRQQFAMGRTAAKFALRRIGIDVEALLADANGLPVWPAGAVGSISHKQARAIAAVARSSEIRALGADLENDDATDERVVGDEILADGERRALLDLERAEAHLASPATCLLTMKEAAYKVLSQLGREPAEWPDLTVRVDVASRTFEVTAVEAEGLGGIHGGYEIADGWIASIALLEPALPDG
jgi:4'-phosphopantetheinyl transferase EntD